MENKLKVVPAALDKDQPETNIQGTNPSFIGNGEVIILPNKECFSKSELFQICGEWSAYLLSLNLNTSVLGLSDEFNNWFDKNY